MTQTQSSEIIFTANEANQLICIIDEYVKIYGLKGASVGVYFQEKLTAPFREKKGEKKNGSPHKSNS